MWREEQQDSLRQYLAEISKAEREIVPEDSHRNFIYRELTWIST